MLDYHLHSRVSFDSTADPADIVRKAERLGLSQICFTDHYDMTEDGSEMFDCDEYLRAYSSLSSPSLRILHGVEFGLTEWNAGGADALFSLIRPDLVIGSVHAVDGIDPYFSAFWDRYADAHEAYTKYLEKTLECVTVHNDYDVLGHLSYVCKSPKNPFRSPLRYEDFPALIDEILRAVIAHGKGIEINTSGVDAVGSFLPDYAVVKRFRELGGEIITVGSDAHDERRVGQYIDDALQIAREVFGYVCAFDGRRAYRVPLDPQNARPAALQI